MITSPYEFRDDPHTLRVRLNIGIPGMGKSQLLGYQLRQIVKLQRQKTRSRIILIDPTRDDYHFVDFGRLIEKPTEFHAVLTRNMPSYHLRVVTHSVKFFDLICEMAMEQGDVFLIVDEIWMFCEAGKAGSAMKPEHFNLAATLGRHDDLRILGTCQRPTQIHNNLLKCANEVNVFCTEDLDLLKNKLRKENMQAALSLPKQIFFWCQQGRAPERCEVPK